MEVFALYLFRSVVWLTGFALVYLLFLQNERFFLLKRFYLVLGILISLFFPLISVHYKVELPVPNINPVDFTVAANSTFIATQNVSPDKPFDLRYILLFLYLSGAVFFAFRLIWHIRSIYRTINNAKISNMGQAKLIRTSEFSSSFSFFNYVFINPTVSESEMKEIMNHELVHVRQKHWFDLLLVELIRMMQWANPFMWIYTGFIRLNHEYLADEAALQRTTDPAVYRAALLNQMFSSPVISLSNSFNYSLSKRRFDMMKKIVTSPYRKMKVFFVLPVLAVIFYSFATPEYYYIPEAENQLTLYQSPEIVSKEVRRNIVQDTDRLLPGNDADIPGNNNLPSMIFAKEVKGTVVQEDGKPLQGVIIEVSGGSIGAISDSKGQFAIGNIQENALLVFSYAGYLSQTIKALSGSEMNVTLIKDPEYKEQLKTGRLSTFPSDAKPLIFIDGVESNSGMNMIDPNEISSISVLKNGSSTAAYMEKGANGVILVTTKRKAAGSVQNKPVEANDSTQQMTSAPLAIVTKVVKGIVVGQDGKPLEGASIVIKSTTKGCKSDAKGYFRLSGVSDEDLLVVSYVGFITRVIKPDFTNEMTLEMERYTVTTEPVNINPPQPPPPLNKSTIINPPPPPPDMNFKIRSANGIPPLVVIDGSMDIEVNKIDPGTIESVSVLKDKPAIEKYGEKGKDGVIEVTTKKTSSQVSDEKLSDVKVTGYGNQKTDEDKIILVEEMPVFPGGNKGMLTWISENLKYPEGAVRDKITGLVYVNFVVSSTGKITNVRVRKPVHPLLDAEAIKVISNMPDWKPGKQDGKPVDVDYMVPVDFKLN